jgi:hypothetical protein
MVVVSVNSYPTVYPCESVITAFFVQFDGTTNSCSVGADISGVYYSGSVGASASVLRASLKFVELGTIAYAAVGIS